METLQKNKTVVIGTNFRLGLVYTVAGSPMDLSGDTLELQVFNPATGNGIGRYPASTSDNVASWNIDSATTETWGTGKLGYRVFHESADGKVCDIIGALRVISGRDV